jgi:hypothetical protein
MYDQTPNVAIGIGDGSCQDQDSKQDRALLASFSSSSSVSSVATAIPADWKSDAEFVLLELGLSNEEKSNLKPELRAKVPANVQQQEWIDTDEFLWSPSGQ